ncbi:MAG: recombinase family protein [Oscillospiraceae bacterium]|jgi:DNA invertase Pin-like site-specific DNA recombinase|nr:recombinase family protein [Oscillospiraceae bacterium]
MENSQYFGYARVSTRDQREDRQLIALAQCGIPLKNIFKDKQSGKDFDRPAYIRMIKRLKQGDTLFVKSIDRLGRDYSEILEQWRIITKELQASIVVLDMPLLDTRKTSRDLTGLLIADLVLQILSYVAQTERDFIRKRQAEGIAVAQANGVRFGRPRKQLPQNFEDVYKLWLAGELSARGASRLLGVAHKTFITWAEERSSGG